jgi:hypothetical protein
MKRIIFERADQLRRGHVLDNGHLGSLVVQETSSNSLGNVVLRCGYTISDYPGLTLLRFPEELVACLETQENAHG